jgi:uncharacterized cupredoxin-like copper-binding protein
MRIAFAFLAAVVLTATATAAKADLTRQEPIEVRVNLGNEADARVFEPTGISFEVGKLYRLVLHNPSKTKHYFTSPGLADRVFTRKVEVLGADGKSKIGEIKGSIREIEVYPGGTAEWWFVPVAAVDGAGVSCNVKDEDGKTHTEKGMVGSVTIK